MNLAARTPLPVLSLTVFSIAFGIEEAIIVVYLRHSPGAYMPRAFALEGFRELTTLFVIGAIAWLTANSAALRARAFCFSFGLWDIVYYVALWKLTGFPSITDNDVLFLIPVPWIAPVWAPVSFAVVLILIGLFGHATRRGVLLAAGFALALLSFVYRTAFGVSDYPIWLFLLALALALASLPVETGMLPGRPETVRRRGL
ncbi:MAG: hypothetical protein JO322_00620 [Candidatus Eremiobacteraeota bacterium]|nr:hypothetical protein [Candidatus Eremiobacteraeota bacterium]